MSTGYNEFLSYGNLTELCRGCRGFDHYFVNHISAGIHARSHVDIKGDVYTEPCVIECDLECVTDEALLSQGDR